MFSDLETMLERFLDAKNCIQHVPKPIQVPKTTYLVFLKIMYVCQPCMYAVCILCMHYMYVLDVCIICMYYMYYMYVLYVCIICMYYMYVLYVCSICMSYMYVLFVCISVQEFSFLCKASQISRPPGAKIHRKTIAANPRRSIFEKESALNLVLIANSESRGKMLHIPLKIMDLGALCVELWLKQVLYRILVPMSYISFWEQGNFYW